MSSHVCMHVFFFNKNLNYELRGVNWVIKLLTYVAIKLKDRIVYGNKGETNYSTCSITFSKKKKKLVQLTLFYIVVDKWDQISGGSKLLFIRSREQTSTVRFG